MIFNARITFTLSFIVSSGTRFLSQSVKGDDIKDGIDQGSFSKNSYTSYFLAKFDCETYGVKENCSQEQIKNIYSTQTNANINPANIPIPNSLDIKETSQYTDNDI